MGRKIYIYPRFERFWHWAQAALIGLLFLSGFEIHGSLQIWGFEKAVTIHEYAGWSLLVLTVFAIFWHLTTGAWRHYWPVREKVPEICRYYAVDIFRGKPHPFEKDPENKLNPLQRLAYLFLKVVLLPLQFATGLLYYYHWRWPAWSLDWRLSSVATWHLIGTFALLVFLVIHVYLTTTGRPWYAHLRGMILGWEELNGPERP